MYKIFSTFVLYCFCFSIVNFSSSCMYPEEKAKTEVIQKSKAQNPYPEEKVGAEVLQKFETRHPYGGVSGVVWERAIFWFDASYISIHFSKYDLAEGDYVIISSPDGKYSYKYDSKGKKVKIGRAKTSLSDFWATHIPGDMAIVRLYSKTENRTGYGFIIDKWVHGFDRGYVNALLEGLEGEAVIKDICGGDDSEWAPCYKDTAMYDKSHAVCRLLINGSIACTGWLLGSQGHVVTNHHCINSQSDADNTDFEFMAEGENCATSCSSYMACPGAIEASSCTIVRTSSTFDYTLVRLPTNISEKYGYLQLRPNLPNIGDRIYVPQHMSGYGKQLSVKSDSDGPYAKIYSTDEPPCYGGPGDIGYYADTAGGSSGSPVLSYDDNLVVALHHCANCPNRGVPIPSIISNLGADLPENSLGGNVNYPANANFNYAINGLSIDFTDASTDADGTIIKWSWNFDDNTTSTQQNPSHDYSTDGNYNVTLTVTDNDGSTDSLSRMIAVGNAGPLQYCKSQSNDSSYEWISEVKIGSFIKYSDDSNYSDFTSKKINLQKNKDYSIMLTPEYDDDSSVEHWGVWIDFNRDGDFDDPDEEIFSSAGDASVYGTIYVPSSVEATITRLRVTMNYNTWPSPCETFSYGEVEDYTVDITEDIVRTTSL